MKTWLITDSHFGHENIKKYCGRPEGFEEMIIHNFSRAVQSDDILIHLGDVYMGKTGEDYLRSFRSRVKGKHYLTLGNHDKASKTKYLSFFDGVFDSISVNGVYLSHHGVEVLPSGCMYQVYGHHHNSPLPETLRSWDNSYRLSVEIEEYKPVTLDTIVGRIAKGKRGELGENIR